MPVFTADQVNFSIAGIPVGGQPGEYPTLLVGSIFYTGDPIVSDAAAGDFDAEKAKELLDREAELSSSLGVPRVTDVVAESAEAVKRYLDFVLKTTDGPVMIDSTRPDVRMAGLDYVKSAGQTQRVIYNSIDEHTSEEELEVIAESGVKTAVLLAFSPRHLKPADRQRVLDGDSENPGLLDKARRAHVENVLVDVGVLDLPSVGWASEAIESVKEKLGLVSGCAPVNALYAWKRQTGIDDEAFRAAAASTLTQPIARGADYIFYGPISTARWVYPAVAAVDAMVAYTGRLSGIRPKTDNHPLFKIS